MKQRRDYYYGYIDHDNNLFLSALSMTVLESCRTFGQRSSSNSYFLMPPGGDASISADQVPIWCHFRDKEQEEAYGHSSPCPYSSAILGTMILTCLG